MKKLIPIQGDVTIEGKCGSLISVILLGISITSNKPLAGLGLTGDSLQRLTDTVNVVFHCAATLRLEANLKDAIEMNLTGTKRVIVFCQKVKNLSAVVHLSTAFCYCDQEVLLEKVYDCPHEPNDLIRCAEWMDIKTIDKITPNLLQPHPNTYTYSKRLAEILVEKQHPALPICIARPSIGKLIKRQAIAVKK